MPGRGALLLGALAAGLIFSSAPASPTAAAEPAATNAPIALTSALKDRLAAAPGLAGARLRRRDLDGAVVVSFFATWCPPCNIEFRHLADLHGEYAARGLTIVAVNHFEDYAGFGDGGGRLARFLARHDPPFAAVKGNDGLAAALGEVTRIPTVFVFAPDGRAVLRFIHHQGATKTNPTMKELRDAIETALRS